MSLGDGAKVGISIIKRLIPPLDNDPWHRFKFDSAHVLTTFAIGVLVLFHVLLACGYLAVFGMFPGFARADAFDQETQVLASLQAGQISDKIRDAKIKVCLSIQARNQGALEAWARELESQKQQYRDKIHQEPHVMGCDELLIGGTQQ